MTPLVWLPGMMCDARLFAPQLDALGGQVIVSTGQDTIAEMAENVLAQTPESFALAGLSMGGIIAMEVLRQAPDRVAKVALMDTNPKAEHPAVAANREPQIAKVQAGDLAIVMRDEPAATSKTPCAPQAARHWFFAGVTTHFVRSIGIH